MQEFVVGFMFDAYGNVMLIRKKKPEWQKGKLNGIGGKVEVGETPYDAMVREFSEETGISNHEDWTIRAKAIVYDGFQHVKDCIHIFSCFVDKDLSSFSHETNEGLVNTYSLDTISNESVVSNLFVLLPICCAPIPNVVYKLIYSGHHIEPVITYEVEEF